MDVRWQTMWQQHPKPPKRLITLVAVAAVIGTLVTTGCSSSDNFLTSPQQKYVAEVRQTSAPLPSRDSDAVLVEAGKAVCTSLGTGVTMKELESTFHLKLNTTANIEDQRVIDAIVEDAIYYLCPRFQNQLPKI